MIRKRTAFLAAAVASMGLATSAHAQQGAAQINQFRGTNVGTFVTFGPTAVCADGSVGSVNGFGFVFASESVSHQPGGAPAINNGVSIDIFDYFNSCTGDFIGFGVAGFANGYRGPNPALISAAISGSTLVQDLDTGASLPITLNLVFSGQGPVSSSKGTTVTHDVPGFSVIVQRGSFPSRSAGVTGTITINGLEPDASFSSSTLAGNSSATVTVQQQN
jgi:hypothetical protein